MYPIKSQVGCFGRTLFDGFPILGMAESQDVGALPRPIS